MERVYGFCLFVQLRFLAGDGVAVCSLSHVLQAALSVTDSDATAPVWDSVLTPLVHGAALPSLKEPVGEPAPLAFPRNFGGDPLAALQSVEYVLVFLCVQQAVSFAVSSLTHNLHCRRLSLPLCPSPLWSAATVRSWWTWR